MNRLEDFMPNFWDNDGKPLIGGSVEICESRTATRRLDLYSSPNGGNTPLPNPLSLNSAGRADTPVYFDANTAHITVRDKEGAVIKSYGYEVQNAIKGDLKVEEDIEAGRNVIAKENVIAEEGDIVARKGNLDIAGNASIGGQLKADRIEAQFLDAGTAVARNIVANEAMIATKAFTLRREQDPPGSFEPAQAEIDGNLNVKNKIKTYELEVTGTFATKIPSVEAEGSIKTSYLWADNAFVNKERVAVASNIRSGHADMPVGSYVLANKYGDFNAYNNTVQNVFASKHGAASDQSGIPYFYTFGDEPLNAHSQMDGTWLLAGCVGDAGLLRRIA